MTRTLRFAQTTIAVAVLLPACSKSPTRGTGAAEEPSAAQGLSEVRHDLPQTTSAESGASRVLSPTSARIDFHAPCEGKREGDDCGLMLGAHEVRTQCTTTREARLSCGEQQPPTAPSAGSPRSTHFDHYAPCVGKKAGDDCFLRRGTPEVHSNCYAAPEGANDVRLSCGPRPPSANAR